jgi:hypothetical protein
MPIAPDTKDWTWVLERPCPECGFDARDHPRESIGPTVRANAASWLAVLARGDVSARPSDDRWSALEYACHVRDVYRIIDGRLVVMLASDDPLFPNWDQDATADSARYDLQDPVAVGQALVAAASVVADRFDGVHGAQWDRTGTRSNGSRFTVQSLGSYLLHDVIHHLWDVSAP